MSDQLSATGATIVTKATTSAGRQPHGSDRGRVRSMKICELNDSFRESLVGGRVLVTPGVAELGEAFCDLALAQVRAFDSFSIDDDPYEEHDSGAFVIDDENLCWRIDYYDRTLRYGSKDPADPLVTSRVLTIMFEEEA